MKAKDIMTRDIFTLKPETSIGDAINVLVGNAISGAPVLDDAGDILGIVTEKDLLVAYDFSQKVEVPIASFMSSDVSGVSEETTIEEISQMLVQRNVKRVPVLDGKKVLGIVSRRDVLKHILNKRIS